MSPCGRSRLYLFKTFIVVGVEVCVIFSLLLLVELLRRHDEALTQGREKELVSNTFSRRVQEQYQRGLLYKNVSLDLIDGYDVQSKTPNIARRVFDILPRPEGSSENISQRDHKSASEATDHGQTQKFLFVLHHYEQLAKTTENLLQLAAVGKSIGRVIVEPFVRDSRMCGLPSGWFGEARRPSRRFHPLSLYFDVSLMNSVLAKSGYSTMVKLNTFKKQCASPLAENHMIHFVYGDQDSEEMTRKWFNLSAKDYAVVVEKLKDHGWGECNFIDRGLNVSSRIGNVRVGRQICVDPERVRSLATLENEILLNQKCAVIVHWRGIGRNRTHFQPAGHEDTRKTVHSLRHSDFILQGVRTFMKAKGLTNEPYLAIHLRSERQILWYSVDRLLKCVRVLISMALKVKRRYRINKVFLSTDFSAFGSDTLFTYAPQNAKELDMKLKIVRSILAQLTPVEFSPRASPRLAKDKGVVAISEMNVLFAGNHLMTVGSGTFQQWIVDVFIERHSKTDQHGWTVTRICKDEKRQSPQTASPPPKNNKKKGTRVEGGGINK